MQASYKRRISNGIALVAIFMAVSLTCSDKSSSPSLEKAVEITTDFSGLRLAGGETKTITWESTNASTSDLVSISLYRSGVRNHTISVEENDGSYDWTVSPSTPTDSSYQIFMWLAGSNSSTQSDSFTVIAAYGADSADRFEVDDTLFNATNISTDGTSQTHFLTPDDVDWVEFYGSGGEEYLIETRGAIDTELGLYFKADSLVASDSDSGMGGNARIVWTCPDSRTYYVRIAGNDASVSGAYTVRIMRTSSSTSSMQIISPSSSSQWQTGSSVSIRWTVEISGTYVSIVLLRGSTTYLSIASSTSDDGRYTWTVPGSVSSGSNYRVRVISTSDDSRYATSEYFAIASSANQGSLDSLEPDDTRSNANPLDTTGERQNHSLTSGDIDWMTFAADSGYTYTFRFSGDAGVSARIYPRDSSQAIASHTRYSGSSGFAWHCSRDGSYFLRVRGYSSSTVGLYSVALSRILTCSLTITVVTPKADDIYSVDSTVSITWEAPSLIDSVGLALYLGESVAKTIQSRAPNNGRLSWVVSSSISPDTAYRIKIFHHTSDSIYGFSSNFTISRDTNSSDSHEPDDSRTSANSIDTDGTVRSHALVSGDLDWFFFSADSGYGYIIETFGNADTKLRLYPKESNVLLGYNSGGGSGSNARVLWNCRKPDTVFFCVSGEYASSSGSYTVSVQRSLMDSSLIKITYPDSGAQICAKSEIGISWTASTDIQYVRIALFQGDSFVRFIDSRVYNTGHTRWRLHSSIKPDSGYRIRMNSSYDTVNAVFGARFSITDCSDDYEPDNHYGDATAISDTAAGQIHTLSANDEDWFKFSADSGFTYTAFTSGQTDTRVCIYNREGTVLLVYDDDGGDGVNGRVAWPCRASGEYYIKVVGFSQSSVGKYSIHLSKSPTS